MQSKKLRVPEKLNIGFQSRPQTYSGKLAYVSYWDEKGVFRKEPSWNSWRDKKLDPLETANVPTEGFVLNKSGGGSRECYSWNARNEYIRVYDPRGFEFEIDLPNLLFILGNVNCLAGKGLEGEFVYSWDGAKMILLPVGTEEYKNALTYTNLQTKKLTKADMEIGCLYRFKNGDEGIYMGLTEFVSNDYYNSDTDIAYPCIKRGHVYYILETKDFRRVTGYTALAERVAEEPHPLFVRASRKFKKSDHDCGKIIGHETVPTKSKTLKGWYGCLVHEDGNGVINFLLPVDRGRWNTRVVYGSDTMVHRTTSAWIIDGKDIQTKCITPSYIWGYHRNDYNQPLGNILRQEGGEIVDIYAITSKGKRILINDNN